MEAAVTSDGLHRVVHFRLRRYRVTATPILPAGESVGFDGDRGSMWMAGSEGFMTRKPLLRPCQVSSGTFIPLQRARHGRGPSQSSRRCSRYSSRVSHVREQPYSGARSCNCGKYDRRCFYFGYRVCAPAPRIFQRLIVHLRYVDGVVRVAARLDLFLGIRLIDGS